MSLNNSLIAFGLSYFNEDKAILNEEIRKKTKIPELENYLDESLKKLCD